MRRFLLTLTACLLCLAAIPLVGCRTSPINGAALLPASQADLDTLAADVTADRENTAKAIDAVRTDLNAATIATPATDAAHGAIVAKQDEVSARPASGGIGGALISAIAGSGVVPPWLDWLLTLGATALGINTTRNATRKKALAKVAAPATKPTTPTV